MEDNARRAADIMTKNGVVPNVTESRSQGKTYWRVTVGPAPKGRDMNRLLAKVKDLGFTDADRVENIRRVAEVARLMADSGLIVLTAFISPFRRERRMAR